MKCDKKHMILYLVTDRTWLGDNTLSWQVEQALVGGVTCVQLREKELDQNTFLAEALKIKTICQRYNVPFIINDNVNIAIECKADGIHVGQHDMETSSVRTLIPDDMILGVSVQTVKQAISAEKNGADYLGVGAVFSTATKQDADSVSFKTLLAISNAVSIPIVAIGGISANNILELKGLGIDGVALISAILSQKNIKRSTSSLLELSKEMVRP